MPDTRNTMIENLNRMVVLRPNGVGDFVFALPALHTLRAHYPGAKITFIGLQWHADFLTGRPGPIDEVVVMPPYPGIDAPLNTDPAGAQAFIKSMCDASFDLAVQLYGGGRYANPFIKLLGARLSIGLKAPDSEPLDRWVSFDRLQNRRLQFLEVAALIGANTLRLGPELSVTDQDRQQAAAVVPINMSKHLVLIHPSAGDVRRHWSPAKFAAVGDALIESGAVVAVNGNGFETAIARSVTDHMRHSAIDLSGKLSLGGLCGMIERASLVVSNDSGPLHLALAIGKPAVGIYWLTNLFEAGPIGQDRHRAALSARVDCPICGANNVATRCPHDVSFVDDVTVEEVLGKARELLLDSRWQ